MIASALQTLGTPGQPGRRAVPAGMRRAAGTPAGHGVTRQAVRAVGAAPLRREDCAGLVLLPETQGQFAPAPPEPAWADPQGVFGALVGIRCCGAATPALALARSAGASVASSGGATPAWRLLRGELSAAVRQAVRAQWLTPALALARSTGASVPHLKVLQGLLGGPAAVPAAEAQNL